MRHVVMYSGGVSSWYVANLLARAGIMPTLLFADTLAEDEDLYRFNRDVENDLNIKIVRVADGRTPQQVGIDRRHLGNTQVANCSHLLKQKPAREWVEKNTVSSDTIIYLGLGWWESHRVPAVQKKWLPWRTEFPLLDTWHTRERQFEALAAAGIAPPASLWHGI